MRDTTTKEGFDYRKALEANLKNPNSHPMNNGVHMQAHHLISEEGIKEFKPLLKGREYNINVVANMAFIPSTPAAACHMNVQLHRGDHTHIADEHGPDDEHPKPYHKYVAKVIEKLEDKIEDCQKYSNADVQRWLDNESMIILSRIKQNQLALTKIYKAFYPSSAIGCGNCINVNDHAESATPCNHDRNHRGKANPMYISSKNRPRLTIQKYNYKLRVGQ